MYLRYVIHEKMAKSEKAVDEEFLDSFTNWLVLLEMADHLVQMQTEHSAKELDHGNLVTFIFIIFKPSIYYKNSEWGDRRHEDGRENKAIERPTSPAS